MNFLWFDRIKCKKRPHATFLEDTMKIQEKKAQKNSVNKTNFFDMKHKNAKT